MAEASALMLKLSVAAILSYTFFGNTGEHMLTMQSVQIMFSLLLGALFAISLYISMTRDNRAWRQNNVSILIVAFLMLTGNASRKDIYLMNQHYVLSIILMFIDGISSIKKL